MFVLMRAGAAALWAATIGLSFTPADPRLWACALAAASVLSLALICSATVGRRIDKAYVAMAQALITRPDEDGCDGIPRPRGSAARYRA